MKTINYKTDLCVVGGGLAGLCCAIAASRHGIKTVLVQDRPVLGGNASEEIRMWICGAHGEDNRETGIVEELTLENFYFNKQLKYPLWDSVLYGKAKSEPNLTLLLNSSCLDATMDGNRISSIKAWQSNAETFHVVEATYFADCSGDSVLAPLSGADYMYGREAKSEYNETIPPDVADKKTMGMSCMFQIRETDHKVDFVPPEWAYVYESDEDLPYKEHPMDTNFWWIEVGGEWDCIHDADRCRDELLKIAYGIWDHMKNRGNHGADNYELEWIGFLPGKRESRRYVGKYVVTQNDVEAEGRFEDIVAYGGWTMDDHHPMGFHYEDGPQNIFHPAPSPWGIPLRSMISANIDNLVFAGRNISVTHAALSSSRVMATCSILGQAIGTAVAVALADDVHVSDVDIKKLQQILMNDDCYLPWQTREIPAITTQANCTADIVRNGVERGEPNCWKGNKGDTIEYIFAECVYVDKVRLVFDSNLNRGYNNMPCRYLIKETKFKLPDTLLRDYRIDIECADGSCESINVTDNHQRLVYHNIGKSVNKVSFVPLATNGCEEFRVFGFELV